MVAENHDLRIYSDLVGCSERANQLKLASLLRLGGLKAELNVYKTCGADWGLVGRNVAYVMLEGALIAILYRQLGTLIFTSPLINSMRKVHFEYLGF